MNYATAAPAATAGGQQSGPVSIAVHASNLLAVQAIVSYPYHARIDNSDTHTTRRRTKADNQHSPSAKIAAPAQRRYGDATKWDRSCVMHAACF